MQKIKSYNEKIRGNSLDKFKTERLEEMKEMICDEVPKRVAHNLGVKK